MDTNVYRDETNLKEPRQVLLNNRVQIVNWLASLNTYLPSTQTGETFRLEI